MHRKNDDTVEYRPVRSSNGTPEECAVADATLIAAVSGTAAGGDSDRNPTTADGSGQPTTIGDGLVAGRYRISGWLGEGGMGSVYKAVDIELDETVALKVLRRALIAEPEAVERFRREVKLARRVTHVNVARTFDIGEHGGEKFLTMEYVEGKSLGSTLRREGALPLARALDIGAALCAGLSAAHAAGVVHRDLKPDNVMLAADGRVVITDFGVACVTAAMASAAGLGAHTAPAGVAVGTPSYMAPEQIEGRGSVDARADVYATGALLYEMVTGARPWSGETPLAVAVAQTSRPPPDPRTLRPSVPEGLAEVIRTCMARDPNARYPTAAALGTALAGVRSGVSGIPVTSAGTRGIGARGAPARSLVPTPPPAPSGATAAPARVAPSSPGVVTIAVLPFRHGAGDEYLADGLTEDLIDTLSMTAGLRLRPRGVVMPFKATELDPRDLGRQLDVTIVVDGSVRRVGDRLRVSTRLLGVRDGFQLWATRMDRGEAEILAASDEIARAIAGALSVHVDGPTRPSDPRAVELYLRGRHELRQFWGQHVARAAALFEEALTYAPEVPAILGSHAFARYRIWFHGAGREVAEAALEAAQRAAAAAPQHGEGRLALGLVLLNRGETEAGVTELAQALARAPMLPEAHEQAGRILVELGAIVEGCERLAAAAALDPQQAPLIDTELARIRALSGEWDTSTALLERAAATAAPPIQRIVAFNRARLALWRGDRVAAAEALAAGGGIELGDGPGLMARVLFQAARDGTLSEEALAFFARSAADPHRARRRQIFFDQIRTELATVCGQPEVALTALEAAAADGLIDINWVDRCPVLPPLRADPRFEQARAIVQQRAARALAAFHAASPAPTR